jgi:hypothetical protein
MITCNRKITQFRIVQELIFEQMNAFNNQFEDTMTKKVNLVQNLEEKNKRIRQLIRILKLNPDDYVIFDPVPQDDETPDAFLTVRDNEVHLRKQIDQGDQQQEQTGELEKDSFAERALRQMMGGNVNMSNLDDAPQEDEPVRPEWMDQKKKEELTEEEQYQIQEFDKKLKNFIEEREKRRKALSAELTKLVKGNLSSIEDFDRQMALIYMRRFDCEERVYYFELEIIQIIDALTNEDHYRTTLRDITEQMIDKGTELKRQETRLVQLKEISAQFNELSSTAESNLENLKSQVMKEFKNKDCLNTLRKLFDGVAKRLVPKVIAGPNVFHQFLQESIGFADGKADLLQSQPPSLAESPWRNFIEYCDRKILLAKDAAEKTTRSTDMKGLIKAYDEMLDDVRRQLKELTGGQSDTAERLLLTRVDRHVPFTFRQGQVEIPSEIVIIDYSDVCLIDKKVVMDRNRLILDAGKRKLDELENIRQQRSNQKMLKWEIDKFKVDLENLNEEVKEYQLFRVTKLDQELIMGGGKNRNQSEVNSLNNSLQHTQKTHEMRLKRANTALKKLKQKVIKKRAENLRIEEEILQMQLGLKERKRIYNIQMKSSEGAAEARKSRLKQVMLISRLKRAMQVQETKIQELQAEVTRLRKCVYATFNENDEFDTMVGYRPNA